MKEEKNGAMIGLDTPIENCNLGARAAKALKFLKVKTVGDVTNVRKQDLLRYKDFGKKSLEGLEKTLEKYQVKLKE
jgi:DNA-directed RNA polymerase alpha subunit